MNVPASGEPHRAVLWCCLAAAIALEVAATLSLRASFDNPAWAVLVAVGYIGSVRFLTRTLAAGMAIGVAYGIWSACGVALTAVAARALFGERLTGTMIFGIIAIACGVLLIELGAHG